MYHGLGLFAGVLSAGQVRFSITGDKGESMAFVLALLLFVVVLGILDRALPWPTPDVGGTGR
jgi:hypothetical protein